MGVSYETLEHVAMEARPYPTRVLKEAESGLVLFAAAFLGHNDAIHFAETDMPIVECVDIDGERLSEMEALYPSRWTFTAMDAWDFADRTQETWDVVSLDPFTGDMMADVMEDLELFAGLANKALIVGSTRLLPLSEHPDGFRPTKPMVRAAGVYWLVFERA